MELSGRLTISVIDHTFRNASHARGGSDRAAFYQRRDDRRLLRDAEYVCHESIVRQRFRRSKRKVIVGPFLLRFFGFGPARFSGLPCASFPLFVSHRLKASLAADLAALRPHLTHDLLNNSKFRSPNRFEKNAPGVLDIIKFFRSAFPLWHMPQAWHETKGRSSGTNFK